MPTVPCAGMAFLIRPAVSLFCSLSLSLSLSFCVSSVILHPLCIVSPPCWLPLSLSLSLCHALSLCLSHSSFGEKEAEMTALSVCQLAGAPVTQGGDG